MIIGSHVSMSTPEFVLGSVKEALSYGANALMLYTGAPQNTRRKPVEELRIEEAQALMEEEGIPMENLIIHAPYVINPANSVKPEVMELARTFLIEESHRTAKTGATYLVLHPGSYTTTDPDMGLKTAAQQLNEIDPELAEGVTICLETMAGKGSEIGTSFEQLEELLSSLQNADRYGICLDTCHINDAGYDVSDFDTVLDAFDRIIGLGLLHVIHLNDSKNPIGAHKDRHENIGFGTIGFDALHAVAANPRTAHIAKILETPWIKGNAPYGIEIDMLKRGVFEPERIRALGHE
ncbi:MAG: deoxyribonuclease IV [Solobacterium sp.]|nr:deoxyribonuclease IV [Solobacterium sp.]